MKNEKIIKKQRRSQDACLNKKKNGSKFIKDQVLVNRDLNEEKKEKERRKYFNNNNNNNNNNDK